MNIDKSLAQVIDHTLLRPDLTKKEIFDHCQQGIKYRFKTVCIPPYFVNYAKTLIEESQTGICTVVGFPLGYGDITAKVEEVKRVVNQGCDEIDFVINIAAVKNEDWSTINDEFDGLCTVAHMKNKTVKAILETGLLTTDEIRILSEKAKEYRVDFIKTSTGMSGKGAELKVVKQIKKIVGDSVKIKASGGIKTKKQALAFIKAGADRIGTSSGIQIVQE